MVIVDRHDNKGNGYLKWSKQIYQSKFERWHFIEFSCQPIKMRWYGSQKASWV